jgi:hypothetical protein
MRPITLATTDATGAATTSGVAALDHYISPFNVGVAVRVTGTVNYTVQVTYDDVFASGFTAASATWFDNADATGQTASKAINITGPVRGIRVRQASGAGSTSTTVLQAGRP